MKTLNQVTLLGRLGRDAETSFTANGKSVTKFSIATENSYKVGDEWKTDTSWNNCVAWGKDKVAAYMTKGSQVLVTGRLNTRSYDKDGEKKYVTEVVVDNIVLCGGRSGSDNGVGGGAFENDGAPF